MIRERLLGQRLSAVILMAAALLLLAGTQIRAAGAQPSAPQPGAETSGLILERDGAPASARLVAAQMASDIAGPVVETRLRQVFRNDGAASAEAQYLFPLPADAALHSMTIRIGERVIEGQVRERERARRLYEAAKRAGERAGLVEQQRPNLFTTRFANVPAGATVVVELGFQQTATQGADGFELVLPQVVTRRYMPALEVAVAEPEAELWRRFAGHIEDAAAIDISQNEGVAPDAMRTGGHALDMLVRLRPGARLAAIGSPSHALAIDRPATDSEDPTYFLRFADGPVTVERDVVLRWRTEAGEAPRTQVFVEERTDGLYLMGQVLPPGEAALTGALPPRDVTFVLDTSGSMHGESIAQAKRALARAVETLDARDRFDVIRFADDMSRIFGMPEPADRQRKRRALATLDRFTADGGTEMRPALAAALADRPAAGALRQIVFLTDGAVGNEVDLFAEIVRDLGPARLFTIGLGPAPNDWFLRKAAEFGRGTSLRITDLTEADARMAAFYARIARPAWTDLSLLNEGDTGAALRYPARLPDLYAEEPLTFAMRVDRLPDALVLTGARGRQPFSLTVPAADFRPAQGIARFWARRRIEALMDRLPLGAEEAAVREAVLETALTHRLASRWTSFVAIDTGVRETAAPDGPDAPDAPAEDGIAAQAFQPVGLTVTGPATGLGDMVGPALQGALLIGLGAVLLLVTRRRRSGAPRFAMMGMIGGAR